MEALWPGFELKKNTVQNKPNLKCYLFLYWGLFPPLSHPPAIQQKYARSVIAGCCHQLTPMSNECVSPADKETMSFCPLSTSLHIHLTWGLPYNPCYSQPLDETPERGVGAEMAAQHLFSRIMVVKNS